MSSYFRGMLPVLPSTKSREGKPPSTPPRSPESFAESSMSSVELPLEIWFHIASFIPDAELCDMLEVSRIFFNIAMDVRWKQVIIATRMAPGAMSLIKRLSDPFIARRVRYMKLTLTQVKVRPGVEATPTYYFVNPVYKVLLLFNSGHSSGPRSTEKQSLKSKKSPSGILEDIVDAFSAIVPLLSSVVDLTIDSWDLFPTYDLKPLFISFWTSFGTNLRSLTLGGNLQGYRALIATNPILTQLTELRVEFTNNIYRVDDGVDLDILVQDVAPFINTLSSHLINLRIWSWTDLDLSTFFMQLSPSFPELKYFNTRTAFNKSFRTDPSGLKDFIANNSRTIRKLDLRLNPSGFAGNEPLSDFLTQCLNDKRSFRDLRSLDIFPTDTTAGMEFMLACIDRISNTVEDLKIRDRYFLNNKASLVIDAVAKCGSLTSLRINLMRLDMPLLDKLAAKAFRLETLWLSINNSLSLRQQDPFFSELRSRLYVHWRLKDLSIWYGGQEIDHDCMIAIAQSIPSINSFFGHGHMGRY